MTGRVEDVENFREASAVSQVEERHTRNFIDGEWRAAASGQTRTNVNPGDTTDVIAEFAESGGVDADTAVDAAVAAGPAWKDLGPIKRAEFLRRAETLLTDRAEEFAAAITREQGKLLEEARGEVKRALAILDFTA